MTNTLYDVIKENSSEVEGTARQMWNSIKIISDFLEELPEEYDEKKEFMLEEIKDAMCIYLNKEMAEHYTSKIINEDNSKGPHYNMEQVKNTLESKGIPTKTENYNFYDIYTQINLVYSDLGSILDYDVVKIINASLSYLNDKDFCGKGNISYTKWYCESKEELSKKMKQYK